MPNRSPLGGSPLGLIGLKSSSTTAGMSTFNGGKSRNVNVNEYNKSRGGTLFTGKRNLRAWPQEHDNFPDYTKKTDPYAQKSLHSDNVYDTSVLNIIEQLSNTRGQLKPTDFAYLKNIGVYPNNRLMIARRFSNPTTDNVMYKKKDWEMSSLAAMISWVPEGQDFLDISFGEEWIEAEADFKSLLNSLGQDVSANGAGTKTGDVVGSLGNAIPLPGFTEIFQRQVLEALGIFDKGAGDEIPAGNPNLIKQAKRRKTVPYTEAGSGLTCTVSIKMVCEYELKYISGIDPTIVWMDLLGNITRFGTSESIGYGLSKEGSSKITKWVNSPNQLVTDFLAAMKTAITKVKDSLKDIFKDVPDSKKEPTSADKQKEAGGFLDILEKGMDTALKGLVLKYRVRLIGILNSLSGLPSTPWHITIGNPLRPVFCSGDMLTQNVSIKLGPVLSFNDLPTSITAEFTLTNARPWGIQEIMAKFNSGYLRTVDNQKSFYETSTGSTKEMEELPLSSPPPTNTIGGTSSLSSNGSGQISNVNSTTTPNTSSSQGGSNANPGSINKDANGSNPIK